MMGAAERAPGSGGAAGRDSSDDAITLFALGSALLRHRWRIARWAFIGAAIPVLIATLVERTWTASASFVPQGSDAGQSGLRSLAGQFGVAIPGGSSSATQSPEFYADLVTARVILGPIVDDTVAVAEQGGRRRAVLDLLDVRAVDPAERRERGIEALRKRMSTSVSKLTGVVKVTLQMAWPSAALAVTERILQSVNRFNLQTRQSQAAEERRFVEARLAAQRRNLLDAEGRLGAFLRSNRQFANAPGLTFEYDRLQREVALQQQVLVGLAQSFEEARIREVRDVPVVTVIEAPVLPVRPDSRGRLVLAGLGAVVGAFLGMIGAFMRDMYVRRRVEGDQDAAQFAALVSDLKHGLLRIVRGRRRPRKDVE